MEREFVDISHIALLELSERISRQLTPAVLNGTLIKTSLATGAKFEIEEYGDLEAFYEAAGRGDTPLAVIEGQATHMGRGLFGLKACPFAASIRNYKQLNSEGLPPIFADVTTRYNADRAVSRQYNFGIGSGVSPFCAIHQPMRSTVGRRIHVGGKPMLVVQLACKAGNGHKGFAPDEWFEALGFSHEEVDAILDDHACCYAVTLEEI